MGIKCGFPVRMERNGNHIVIEWTKPVDITSNLTIKARKTTSSTTKLDAIVVMYREKVT